MIPAAAWRQYDVWLKYNTRWWLWNYLFPLFCCVCMDFVNYEFEMTCTQAMSSCIRTQWQNQTKWEKKRTWVSYYRIYGRWLDLTCVETNRSKYVSKRTEISNIWTNRIGVDIWIGRVQTRSGRCVHEFRWLHQKNSKFDEEAASATAEKNTHTHQNIDVCL